MSYQKYLDEIEPRFDDCGSFCEHTGKFQSDLCKGCPFVAAKDEFKTAALESLNANPNIANVWQKFGFENICEQVVEIVRLSSEDVGSRTILTDRLINIWNSEKYRVARTEQFNKQPPKPR